MHEYVECENCRFVYQADGEDRPFPKGHTECPNCSGEDFQFTD